jgi:hypothetical protein
VKKNIVDRSGEQLEYLQKNRNAFLSQYFERIAEQQKFQHELWEMYFAAKERGDKDFQILCIKELKDISVVLTDLYNMLPEMRGLHFESDNINEKLAADKRWAIEQEESGEWAVGLKEDGEYSSEAKF